MQCYSSEYTIPQHYRYMTRCLHDLYLICSMARSVNTYSASLYFFLCISIISHHFFFFLAKALSCFLVSLKSEILACYPQFVFSGYRGELVLTCTVEGFFLVVILTILQEQSCSKDKLCGCIESQQVGTN